MPPPLLPPTISSTLTPNFHATPVSPAFIVPDPLAFTRATVIEPLIPTFFMDRKRGSRSDSPQHKRQKVTHDTGHPSRTSADADGAKNVATALCAENLASGLLNEENVARLRHEYATNEPFKYARVEALFQDSLLRKVKDECMTHLSFTEKETDIYRVRAFVMRFTVRPHPFSVFTCAFPPPRAVTMIHFLFSHEWTHLPTLYLHPPSRAFSSFN